MARGRSVVALAVAVGVAVGTADATITPSSNAPVFAAAIASDPSLVTGAAFVAVPPSGSPDAVSSTPLAEFPTNGGTYAILSTGDATLAAKPNTAPDSGVDDGGNSVRGGADLDVTILRVDLDVPADVNCLSVDFRFLSDEYPEFVGEHFNDTFVAELDKSDWKASAANVIAPHNFAFDSAHNPMSVNATGRASATPANAAGTTYDAATPLLSAFTPVTPGRHSLYLSIFDEADGELDSAVFVDNVAVGQTAAGNCETGVSTGGGVNGANGGNGGNGGATKPFPVAAGPVTGTILVQRPGTKKFLALSPGTPIRNGTVIDAAHGTVTLPAPGGSDVFYGGIFALFSTFEKPPGQPRRPIVELRLTRGNFKKVCARKLSAVGAKPKKPVNTLWGKGKGHFRTRGRYAAATVRGTFWLTQDRCDGTLIRVRRGKVEVRDFVRHRKRLLKRGKTYLAHP